MIASTNDEPLSAREWTHIDLKDRHNRIVTAINVLLSLSIKIKISILKVNILVSPSMVCRTVQWEKAIKVLDLIMKAITLMTTVIDHFNQGHLTKQDPCWMLHLWAILTLSTSLSSHISHDNRVSHRLMTDHHYKSRAETRISFLVRGSTRALTNQETKAGILIEIHSRSPSLLSRPITLTIKKIRLQMTKRTISSTRMYSTITHLRKTFKSMRHL